MKWKLVPEEPTEDMLVAGQEEYALGRKGAIEDCIESADIYKAMIALAPQSGNGSGWISVKDRLPDIGGKMFVPVLVFRTNNPYPTTRFYKGNGNFNSDSKITHWMPLPESPK